MSDEFNLTGKTAMILGGTGSWGNNLTSRLLDEYDLKEIIIYSRGELKQVDMRRKFSNNPKIKFTIGDVRDSFNLDLVMKGVDIVFDLAALKHVPVCEENPWEAVQTNIVGTHNAINAAIKNNVSRFILVSTDKAGDPFNLYGTTKSCAEKLVIAANNFTNTTNFLCVRGGNVLGTSGSVLPLFKKLLGTTNHISITDPAMTRFMMPLNGAMDLVFHAAKTGVGGEIFVTKMPSASIGDIADVMVDLFGNSDSKQSIIGARPGEKLDELLVSKNESSNTKTAQGYFIVLPAIDIPRLNPMLSKYSGLPSRNELKAMLKTHFDSL